jgi:hypothetical protein
MSLTCMAAFDAPRLILETTRDRILERIVGVHGCAQGVHGGIGSFARIAPPCAIHPPRVAALSPFPAFPVSAGNTHCVVRRNDQSRLPAVVPLRHLGACVWLGPCRPDRLAVLLLRVAR